MPPIERTTPSTTNAFRQRAAHAVAYPDEREPDQTHAETQREDTARAARGHPQSGVDTRSTTARPGPSANSLYRLMKLR